MGSFLAAHRPSSCGAQSPECSGFSSCSTQPQLFQGLWDLSSLTRDRTRALCIGSAVLTTSTVPASDHSKVNSLVAFSTVTVLAAPCPLSSLELVSPFNWLYPEEAAFFCFCQSSCHCTIPVPIPTWFLPLHFSNGPVSLHPSTFWGDRSRCLRLTSAFREREGVR